MANYDNNNKTGAFLLGAAIGSVLALMFAPFSGRKMRSLAKEKGKKAFEDVKSGYNDFQNESLEPTVERARQQGQETLDKAVNSGKRWFNKTTDTVADQLEKASGKVREVRGRVSEDDETAK